MRVSASIMAHPARAESVARLQEQLGGGVPVSWDPDPGPPSSDTDRRWRTGVGAWSMVDESADWHVVLQDDVVVCDDFLAGLGVALDQMGRVGVVSAYAGTGRPDQQNVRAAIRRAEARRESWFCTRSLNWGPAIVLPVAYVGRMLGWCSTPRFWTHRPGNYDFRIGVWARDVMRWRAWYTFPSLVQTGGLPSLIGNDVGRVPRRAHRFDGGSALGVDWSRTPQGRGLEPYL